jgi:hypothetical protein
MIAGRLILQPLLVTLFVNQIENMRQRPRCGAVAISGQSAAQRFNWTSMLHQQRGGDGPVASVGVEDGAMLGRGQKDLSRMLAGIIKEPNARRVGEAAMLELENQMRAPVRQAAALLGSAH